MNYIPVDTVIGLILPFIPDDGKTYELMELLDDIENSEDIIDIDEPKKKIREVV